MIFRKFKAFIVYAFALSLGILVVGLLLEFVLVPILFMLTVDSGYQPPKMERLVLLAKVICLVCPVGALIATILLDRR